MDQPHPVTLLESADFRRLAGEPDASGPTRRRVVVFQNAREKADYLDEVAHLDAGLEAVERCAKSLERDTDEATARAVFAFCRDGIVWVEDPADAEQFASSDLVLERRWGDCDDKARLAVALLTCLGFEARIRAVFSSPALDEFVHVQLEVRWSGSSRLHDAQPGGWIVGELILRGAELGEGAEARFEREFW